MATKKSTKETQEVVVNLSKSMLVVLPEVTRLHNFSFEAEKRLDNLELANQVDRASYIAPLRERVEYVEADLTEETARRVEDIKELRIAVNGVQLGETEIHQLRRDIDIVLKQHNLEHSDICKRLKIIEEWPIDGHERRLAKLEETIELLMQKVAVLERKAQVDKYPNLTR